MNKNKPHQWKLANATTEETTYHCMNCKEDFYVNELDLQSPKTPPRKGCVPMEQSNA